LKSTAIEKRSAEEFDFIESDGFEGTFIYDGLQKSGISGRMSFCKSLGIE
jgi:hypothetical protein